MDKRINGYERMNSKVKDWLQTHVVMDLMDQKKQKILVVVVVIPMGVMHYDTTNMDNVVVN